MNILKEVEKEQIAKLSEGKSLPTFKPGDTLKVHTKVKEGDRERIQVYEGVCIARKNDGLNSSFTVRKISFGEGVERVFPLYSPNIAKIEVSRIGRVRRAKLYFLRALRGRSARIACVPLRRPRKLPFRKKNNFRRLPDGHKTLFFGRGFLRCMLCVQFRDCPLRGKSAAPFL